MIKYAPFNNTLTYIMNEMLKRRTFAIISHPDAGKTTITEKILLFGGAINVAGAVKSNKTSKAAVDPCCCVYFVTSEITTCRIDQ